jgi:hypothetical protein
MMRESDIQSQIMIALGEHPRIAWCYVTSAGSFRVRGGYMTVGVKGMPDILGQIKESGVLFGIEIKKDNGIVSEDQKYFINLINGSGGIAGVARSVSDAIKIIESDKKL